MATRTATVEITMPQVGESVTEGVVLEWRRQVGDRVEADEPLVEISTDKVDAEVPAPASGTLAKILAEPDQTVQVGAVLGEIAVGGAGAPEVPAPETEAPRPATPSAAPEHESRGDGAPQQASGEAAHEATAKPSPTREEGGPASKANGDSGATPVALRIAAAHGVDLSTVRGTGPRGRVTKEDVLAALQGDGVPGSAPATGTARPAAPADLGAEPIRGPAATLVRFMNESRSIPTATSFRTLPVDVLDAKRRELKAAGKRLSFTHLIAWAIVQAARDWPVMAHSYAEEDGAPQRVVPPVLSLGLAVDVERRDGTRSLVVPVIRDASELGFAEFASRYDELVAGARDNVLAPEDYAGANITLTNPGGLGTVASVPRLMPGQGTIVATGAIG